MRLFFLFYLAASLFGQPQGFKLISGNATAELAEVTSVGNTCIEWDHFSIHEHEIFRFSQDSAKSTVLNRVTGPLGSEILGQLHSNGQVILVNPHGIVIGPNARINTAGLIASSLDISDENWRQFQGTSCEGVVHLGYIEASGDVFLLGPVVRNEGTIRAEHVGIGVAHSVLIRPEGSQRVFIQASTLQGEEQEGAALEHSGLIEALRVELRASPGPYAKAIGCSGVIDANRVEERGGEIYLVAEEGICEVTGNLTARGGKVHVLGDKVGLFDEAQIDVSEKWGGGEILIGGDFQGKNSAIKNAQIAVVGDQTVLRSDALEKGNGGKVIIWGDEATRHYGRITARGGVESGDGGFVEVSGKYLDFQGRVDTEAPRGKVGTLLLDPTNITISTGGDSGGSLAACPSGVYTPSGTSNVINTTTLQNALASCSVTINTSSGAAQTGVITVSNAVTWSAATTLTLTADSNIVINANISNSSSSTFTAMNFTGSGTSSSTHGIAVANGVTVSTSGGGGITMYGQGGAATGAKGILVNGTGAITTVNGAISLTGLGSTSGGSNDKDGLSIRGAVNSVDGTITLAGTGGNGGSANVGINIITSTGIVKTTGAGNINVPTAQAGTGTNYLYGFSIGLGAELSVVNGTLTITNARGGNASGASDGLIVGFSVGHSNATLKVTGSGSIVLTGTGGSISGGSTYGCPGIAIYNTGTVIASSSGNVTMNGVGGTSSSSNGNPGIEFVADTGTIGTISSQGSGTITLNGTAGSGNNSRSIALNQGSSILVSTAASTGSFVLTGLPGTATGSGPLYGIDVGTNNSINFNASSTTSLSMTGTGGPGSGGSNYGVRIANTITCNGAITINGTGGSGGSNNFGCFLGVGLTTKGGAITFGNSTSTSVFLNTGLTLDSTNGGGTPAGANISFTNAPISGAQSLTLRAGTSGAITLANDVGASGTRLTGLTFTSGNGLTLGNNSTSSTIYTTGITFAPGMAVTLAGTETIDTNGGAITFSSTIAGPSKTLTLTANAGAITLGGDVGTSGSKLTALTLTSNVGNAITLGGVLYAANGVTFTNANPLSLTTSATTGIVTTNTAITIPSTVNGAASFTLNAGSSTVTISGVIGGTTAIGALTCTGSSIALPTSTKTAGGAIQMNGPVAMSGAVALDSTNGGGTPAGANIAITGAVTGAHALSIRAGSNGAITFGSTVGTGVARLTGLTLTSGLSLSLGGNVFLNANPTIPMQITLTADSTIDTGP